MRTYYDMLTYLLGEPLPEVSPTDSPAPEPVEKPQEPLNIRTPVL